MAYTRGARGLVTVVLAALSGVGWSCGGGSGGGAVAPAPPTSLTLSWQGFDAIVVSWTPPPQPVDRYVAEGRIGSGAFELIDDAIPGDATGGVATLDAAVPELVTVGIRLRAVRGGRESESTPEATLLRGLRAPLGLTVHAELEDVALSWTRGSTAAESLVVERATWDPLRSALGPYATVATLPPDATSWVDRTTSAPGVAYGYRVGYAGTYVGAPVLSEKLERMADATTSLSPPLALQATVAAEGVRLSWTPTSRNGTAQHVERSPATAEAFSEVATLGASATNYLDPAPPAGGYLYRVAVSAGATLSGSAVTAPASAFVAPSPGAWGLAQEVQHAPLADGVARGADGAWWLARHWTVGSSATRLSTRVFTPAAAGGWTEHALGGAGGEYLVDPGVVLDPQGRPHVLWLLNVDPTPTTSPRLQLRHAWADGGAWSDELVAERVFSSDNLSYRIQLAMDGAGALHVLWIATQLSGTTMLTLREYATDAGGAWTIVPAPLALLDATSTSAFRLAAAPDGSLHVALVGSAGTPAQAALVHARRAADGAWTEEVVPTGPLSFFDSVRLVARGADDVDLLYTQQPNGLLPAEYRFQSRTAAGWTTAELLGDQLAGSGNLLASLAASADGTRRAALLQQADGLSLATWEAGPGWTSARIHPVVPFDVPWLGFDAQGVVHVLVPASAAGADGFADWIHLRSTR